jgi:hypothetical protein
MRTAEHSGSSAAGRAPVGRRGIPCLLGSALLFAILVWLPPPVQAQFTQSGNKLVGDKGIASTAAQGGSVALSGDGGIAIVGGSGDNNGAGAAWVFKGSQQQAKLVGTAAAGLVQQGESVALATDGHTVILGGPRENTNTGAAWVFTGSGNVWSQQGNKLVGSGAIGAPFQGQSVALSSDGNTAIVGGQHDNSSTGAVWVFTRSGGVWAQQGAKLVGTGAIGAAWQGWSVALSADGNTALIGGRGDNRFVGAAWVFTRSNGVWTQQGSKLSGSDAVGNPEQGYSVALSGDGNTAIVGGPLDKGIGATWVFTRSGGMWSQQGNKLVGTGGAYQGHSVALSYDGNVAIVGSPDDNGFVGAAWAFTRSGGVWTQLGTKLVGSGAAGAAKQGFSVALSRDGKTAIVGGPWDNANHGAAWKFVQP